jgi:hypothetical protein
MPSFQLTMAVRGQNSIVLQHNLRMTTIRRDRDNQSSSRSFLSPFYSITPNHSTRDTKQTTVYQLSYSDTAFSVFIATSFC